MSMEALLATRLVGQTYKRAPTAKLKLRGEGNQSCYTDSATISHVYPEYQQTELRSRGVNNDGYIDLVFVVFTCL